MYLFIVVVNKQPNKLKNMAKKKSNKKRGKGVGAGKAFCLGLWAVPINKIKESIKIKNKTSQY